MNDDEIREVEHEADRLHFKSALQLLQKTRRTETDDTDWHRLMARILRGLSDSRAALDHARNAGTAPRAQLELAKCLFAAGQTEDPAVFFSSSASSWRTADGLADPDCRSGFV